MSIDAGTTTQKIQAEIAAIETRIMRHVDFQDGKIVTTYPVEILYGKTLKTLDDSGTVTGLASAAPTEQATFVLTGDAYNAFAGYVLTPDEAKLPVGMILPMLIDRAIQAHIAPTS